MKCLVTGKLIVLKFLNSFLHFLTYNLYIDVCVFLVKINFLYLQQIFMDLPVEI